MRKVGFKSRWMTAKKLGLKPGTQFELVSKNGTLILKPIIPEPSRVDARCRKWGTEAFLDAGEATFGGK